MFKSRADYERLCNLLNYRFNNPDLLAQALTRKSGLLENKQEAKIGHSERLEFFGDSILRTVIDDLLLELYPTYSEGELSKKRDKLVAKEGFMHEVAERMDLENFIIMGNGEIVSCQSTGRKKILTDTMEAIIGAIFLDSNRDYAVIKKFISHHSGLAALMQAQIDAELFEAVKAHDLPKVNAYLKKGANPNTIHEFSYTISCPCCLNYSTPSYSEVLRYATRSNALDLAIRRMGGFNQHTLDIVKALLKHGANPNNPGSFRYPALHETLVYYPKGLTAAIDRQIYFDLMKLLCKHGADPNLRSKAIHCGNDEGYEQGYTPLELAIIFADSKKTAALLKAGANPNIKNAIGQTALHLACIYSKKYTNIAHKENNFSIIVNKLIKYGASALMVDNKGRSPDAYTNSSIIKQILIEAFFSHDSSKAENTTYTSNLFTFLQSKKTEPFKVSDFFKEEEEEATNTTAALSCNIL